MKGVPAASELLHRSGTVVLDEDVGDLRESFEALAVLRLLQIEGDARLAVIDRLEVERPSAHEGAERARVVSRARDLDLDDARAELPEDHGAEGAGENSGEVEGLDATKGVCRWIQGHDLPLPGDPRVAGAIRRECIRRPLGRMGLGGSEEARVASRGVATGSLGSHENPGISGAEATKHRARRRRCETTPCFG